MKTYGEWFRCEARVVEDLHACKEGIHIDMNDHLRKVSFGFKLSNLLGRSTSASYTADTFEVPTNLSTLSSTLPAFNRQQQVWESPG